MKFEPWPTPADFAALQKESTAFTSPLLDFSNRMAMEVLNYKEYLLRHAAFEEETTNGLFVKEWRDPSVYPAMEQFQVWCNGRANSPVFAYGLIGYVFCIIEKNAFYERAKTAE